MIMKWQDKREDYILGIVHDENMVDIEKTRKRTNKPEVIVDYNNKMSGGNNDYILIIKKETLKIL